MTATLRAQGYNFSAMQVEQKWRNLVKSHKRIQQNKSKTGAKRMKFHYYEEMENIMAKRHDFNPPVLAGTGVLPAKTRTGSVAENAASVCDNTDESDSDEDEEKRKIKGVGQGKTYSSRLSFKPRPRNNQSDPFIAALEKLEEQRKKENEEKERKRNERAEARNKLLKDFLNALKPEWFIWVSLNSKNVTLKQLWNPFFKLINFN